MFALQVAVMKGRGGVFTSLFHYARMFDAVGVTNVCLYRGPVGDRLREGGVRAIDAPSNLTSPIFPFTPDFGRVRDEIRAAGGGDPDFAMVHSDLALRAVRRMFPRAVLMTRCHSDKTKHKRDADLVVTLNPTQDAMVRRELPGQRVVMLGNPFVPPPDESGPRDEEGPGGRLRINFLGRVEQVKDPITLIRAFAQASLPASTELRIIGAGSQLEEAQRAAADLGKPVTFAGWVNQPFATFDRGDIAVFPSEWESYSWVIREAMHHGVPIIASDIPVHRWALEGGAYGLLFPAGDAGALAVALAQACERRAALREMSAKGRDMLTREFGAEGYWKRLAGEIADIRRAGAQ